VSAAGDLGEGVRLRPRESGTALPTFSASQIAFLDRLAQCSCLTTAWQALHDHVAAIGVTAVNLGLLTNPDGIFGEKDYYYRSSLPDELTKLYYLAGGPRSDPIIPYVAHGGAPVVRDPEGFWAQVKQFSEDLPASLLQFGEALIDFHLGCALCVPLRDADTGAPFCLVFCFDRSSRVEFQEAVAEHERNLSELAQLFWAHLQSMRMLSGLPGLTAREREALMLVVRGFAVCEVAERMQVSGRSAEKFLAGARSKLGARNNAQAVYRAMVYRALF